MIKVLLSVVPSISLNLFLSYQFVVPLLLRSNVSFKSSTDYSSDSLSIFSNISSIDLLSDSLIDSLFDSSINF